MARDGDDGPDLELIMGGAAFSRELGDPAGPGTPLEQLDHNARWFECLADLAAHEAARCRDEAKRRRAQLHAVPTQAPPQLFDSPPAAEREREGFDALRAAEIARGRVALEEVLGRLRAQHGVTEAEEEFLRAEAAAPPRLAARDDLGERLEEALRIRREWLPPS